MQCCGGSQTSAFPVFECFLPLWPECSFCVCGQQSTLMILFGGSTRSLPIYATLPSAPPISWDRQLSVPYKKPLNLLSVALRSSVKAFVHASAACTCAITDIVWDNWVLPHPARLSIQILAQLKTCCRTKLAIHLPWHQTLMQVIMDS